MIPISFPPRSHRAIWRPYASGAYASKENDLHFSALNPCYPCLIFYATGASATIGMLPALNKQRYGRFGNNATSVYASICELPAPTISNASHSHNDASTLT